MGAAFLTFFPLVAAWPPGDSFDLTLWRGAPDILNNYFEMLRGVSGQVKMPLATMVSYAIVYRYGLKKYVAEAQRAGIAGAIVPDLLVAYSADSGKRKVSSLKTIVVCFTLSSGKVFPSCIAMTRYQVP